MMFHYRNTMQSIKPIAQAFRVELYEKEQPNGKGLIMAIGSGLLMATMDGIPSASCAVEYDKCNRENPHFIDFLSLASHWCDYICIHAWFSITKPEALIQVIKVIPEEKLIWKSNVNLERGTEALTFEDLIKQAAFKNAYSPALSFN